LIISTRVPDIELFDIWHSNNVVLSWQLCCGRC